MSVAAPPGPAVRVLFVDDEASILQAMRRALHGMRNQWTMEFVSSGAGAIEAMSKHPADVVVSDMRMPGMDGWDLLKVLQESHPKSIRFILSGQADLGSIMRVIGTAHQYLAKPCDSGVLMSTVERALSLRRLLSSEQLLARVGRVSSLPSLPQTFQEFTACVQRPDVTMQEVALIVGRDIGMTVNIMKVVNSAFFGARQPISQIERAVSFLGLDTLGALVLGEGVFGGASGRTIDASESARLMRHALATAMLARAIARTEKMTSTQGEAAFLAGMLHDVGSIVLCPLDSATDESDSLRSVAGAYLLGLWGFPLPIVEAVAYAEVPSQAGDAGLSLPCLIHVADRLAAYVGAPGPTSFEDTLEPGLLEARNLQGRIPEWLATAEHMLSAGSV